MSKIKKIIFISVVSFLIFGYIASLFLSRDALATLYTFINYIIMIIVLKYIFQKFQLPVFREKLAQKFSFFKSLEDKFKNLKEQNIIAEKEIKDQDKLFENLKAKINTWNKARELQREEKETKLQKISKAHKKRVNLQTQNIYQQKLIKEVFPRVINRTSEQLKQKFAKDQESETFLQDITSYMQKYIKKELAQKNWEIK